MIDAPRRQLALMASLAIALCTMRCSCEPPPPPPDAGVIGAGDPIDPPDAGDPYERDAGEVVCEEDTSEDNDARADAAVLPTGQTASAHFCGEDDDWFSVLATPDCNVLAELTITSAGANGGDVDMLMFDPDGILVGSANTLGDQEVLSVSTTKTGAYAVRIRGGDRDDVGYDITLTTSCAADLVCPTDDRFEDNDAVDAPAQTLEGVATEGILCQGDDDWFNVPVALGCIADATLTFEHDDGDVDLELFRSDGVKRQARSNSTQDVERVTKVVVEGGMRYRVFLFSANEPDNRWRFVVDEICAVSCPGDDPFEPNDARNTARTIEPELDEIVGAICANDDFFSVTPLANCALHAEMTFQTASGDLDLELLDNDGNVLVGSAGTADTETIDFTSPDAARVFFRVFGFAGAINEYRLRVSTTCP